MQKAQMKVQQALTIIHRCMNDVTFEIVDNAIIGKQAFKVLQESN